MGEPAGKKQHTDTHAAIGDLVERFERNIDAYRGGNYNETLVRREFIDPMFAALGWDIDNRAGYAEAYKDVIHEDAIKVGGSTKAPDYSFRVGGTRKFFVEAKKPSVNIAQDIHPAYQLRRYGWSAKLPLSILTDFEELAVYDCRVRPRQGDKASIARTMYFTFDTYVDKWDEISAIFSKEAVMQGSFDKYATSKKKRGTAEVDAEFLKESEKWRAALARNIARKNSALGAREINFAVQRTIDRIIFLRMCEDRGAEQYGGFRPLMNGIDVYGRLMQMFRAADDRYNSGLFHFNDERGRKHSPDTLTPQLKIDDKVLKEIFKGLYYPDSPYEFSVLPADILGNVYEQFLGSVIHLTPSHQAKVEEKPEVKKAGGVYYTPKYIVRYIVEHTIGKLIEGKTPQQIGGLTDTYRPSKKAQPLRFLDPACGSGSFLVGAYKFLLEKHRDWYLDEKNGGAEKHTKRIHQGRGGQWYLTTAEKKRILLSNIYGVDIDSQAVEVTKLNLLLCLMENENQGTIGQMELIHERILPDLSNNIKCGNSLIGSDFYQGQQLEMFDTEAQIRINAFDWETEFSEAFKGKNPGFDAIIGNPPWLMAGYYVKDSIVHLRNRYRSAKGKFDLYYLFLERGMSLMHRKGVLGMITPNKFFHTRAASQLRGILKDQKAVRSLVDFKDAKIFKGATNYSAIIFLEQTPGSEIRYSTARVDLAIEKTFTVPWNILGEKPWHFLDARTRQLYTKMEKASERLEDLAQRFGTGVQSGSDKLLMHDVTKVEAEGFEAKLCRPILRGRNVRRYSLTGDVKVVIFPYEESGNEFKILSERAISSHPRVYRHMVKNKEALKKRVWFSKGPEELSGQWYGMMYLDASSSFRKPHLLTPALSDRANFVIGSGDLFVTGTAGVTSIILHEDTNEDMRYVLGLLNSQLLSRYATEHSPIFSGKFYKFSAPYLRGLPIRTIDFKDPADKSRHDQVVELVDRMLGLQKSLLQAKTDHEKTLLERQIKTTDNQIDKLVYDLYGLTDDEIAIVDGAG